MSTPHATHRTPGTDTTGPRSTAHWAVHPLPAELLAQLRERDDAGAVTRRITDTDGGNPLRCCFGRSTPGETLAFASYAPLRRWARETGADPAAYDESGPVFLHAHDCGGDPGTPHGRFPDAMRGERRTLRAYSGEGRILGGLLLDRSRPDGAPTIEEGLDQLYADPRVATVHVRAVEFGCFLVETRRTDP